MADLSTEIVKWQAKLDNDPHAPAIEHFALTVAKYTLLHTHTEIQEIKKRLDEIKEIKKRLDELEARILKPVVKSLKINKEIDKSKKV